MADIGYYAFKGCSSLTSVNIHKSVTSIGNGAFSDCSSLTSINVANDNPVYTSINGALYNKNTTEILQCPAGKSGNFVFPNSVISIGVSAFSGCKFTSITIPNSVTSIGYSAFEDCSSLASIKIPGSVTTIDGPVFYGCDKLADVTNLATTPQSIDGKTFTYYGTLHVLPGCGDAYRAAEIWKDFTIVEDGKALLNVTLSPAGYATFFDSGSAYSLPNGLSAQVVSDCKDNKLVYATIADGNDGGIIPKGTAVMLVGESKEAGTYTLTPVENTEVYRDKNLLHGSDNATTTSASGTNYFYKLTYGKDNLKDIFGWYWGAADGAAFRIEGHKAWLALPKSSVARSAFALDDDVTGIENIGDTNEPTKGNLYDLQGRRISTP